MKTFLVEQLKVKLYLINNWQKNDKNQSLENLIKNVHSLFIDNIWGTDLADMQVISNFNKRFRFLFRVIDIYWKYTWVTL